MKTIALTGGIACGKSTVAELLRGRGAVVVDADSVAREVVERGRPALEEIAAAFGPGVLEPGGELDREALGAIVFSDQNARSRIDAITHPRIRERMAELSVAALEAGAALLVHDVPLLFETGWNRDYPEILVVYVPREVQLERLVSRNGFRVEDAELRIAAQMPIDDKRKLATWIIDNSGTPEQTRSQFDAWWVEKISRNASSVKRP